ncbi:hypothetical protein IQ07DRAFT_326656 [Pyrenochaeta sp. DS3sAY3a]|nr:hypothetical protein IQ07DRAFT_326656 [Pyrenochaeta sp. DS3sAY3a]
MYGRLEAERGQNEAGRAGLLQVWARCRAGCWWGHGCRTDARRAIYISSTNGRVWRRRESRRDGQRELAAVVQSAGGFGRDEEQWATRRVIESRGAAQEAGSATGSEIWSNGHGLRVQASMARGVPRPPTGVLYLAAALRRCTLLQHRAGLPFAGQPPDKPHA